MDSARSQAQANSVDLTNSVQFSHSDDGAVTEKVSEPGGDPVADRPQRDLGEKPHQRSPSLGPSPLPRMGSSEGRSFRISAIQRTYGLRSPLAATQTAQNALEACRS